MTPRQILLQLRHTAAAILDTDGSILFGDGGSKIAVDASEDTLASLPIRAVLFTLGAESAHSQQPRLSTLTVPAMLLVHDRRDVYGQAGLLELLRVQKLLLDTLGLVEAAGGLRVICTRKSSAVPVTKRPFLARQVQLEIRMAGAVNNEDEFPAVTGFGLAEAGGTVTISWTRPLGYASRYDWRGVTVRRKSGSAPSSATDGTAVVADLDDGSTTDAPGDGTWYYAAFAGYDADSDGNAAHTASTTNYGDGASDSIAVGVGA